MSVELNWDSVRVYLLEAVRMQAALFKRPDEDWGAVFFVFNQEGMKVIGLRDLETMELVQRALAEDLPALAQREHAIFVALVHMGWMLELPLGEVERLQAAGLLESYKKEHGYEVVNVVILGGNASEQYTGRVERSPEAPPRLGPWRARHVSDWAALAKLRRVMVENAERRN